ncbi:universal stress protein [Adhaeribacter rhizoryzae]|uniref:Universal stress protein n=1 Tax=Adhaeribacter rhizoryzae TaxID=2607907 RepID=A0A5M6DM68_9BACT|nr:universal stress protein [Adhaeribacter rhizoryzae]KAA5548648.1 universal stress protein [Adhaeribacter rhizoryzae]
MKNILVPTDFSQNATDAAHYAAALAHITGARLLLFHAYHVSVALADAADLSIDLDLENFENLNQTQIDKLAYDLHLTHGISVTRIMRPGFAADEIPAIAQRLKADLVVMGLRGKGQAAGSKVGQITAAIIQESNVPVLCVPAGFNFNSPFNFRYQLYATATQPEFNIKQKLHNLFGTIPEVTSEPLTNQNPKPVLPAITVPQPDFPGTSFEAGKMLLVADNPVLDYPDAGWLVISADKNTCQQIAVSNFLASYVEGQLQMPVLVLPDAS